MESLPNNNSIFVAVPRKETELRSGKLASGLPALSHFASSIILLYAIYANLCKLLLKQQLLPCIGVTRSQRWKFKSANKNFLLFSVCLPVLLPAKKLNMLIS